MVENQEVWMDDGKIRLVCLNNNQLKVMNGGLLKPGKSIALPGCIVKAPTLTEDDYRNLVYAKEFGVTGIMQPFVRSTEDLCVVRNALNENGLEDCKIYAKIENKDGVEQLESFYRIVMKLLLHVVTWQIQWELRILLHVSIILNKY